MYKIHTLEHHILVKFEADFTCQSIRAIIRHETAIPEYLRWNDIWMIGKHHSSISLPDFETMTAEFNCMCPRNAPRKKTAVVIDQGLTEAIVQLWIKQLGNKIPFEIRIFHTLAEAESWLGVVAKVV